jgi:transcriptional regulator with XRE-family HTH domain
MEKLVSPLKLRRNTATFVYDTEEVGPKLGALRRSQGLTQQDLADALRISVDVLETWENGLVEVYLTDALRRKVCKVFGINSAEFCRHFEWKDLDSLNTAGISQISDRAN